MEGAMEALRRDYDEFVTAVTGFLEARDLTGGEWTPAAVAALENFKNRWEQFRASCDRADELVESHIRQIAWEFFTAAAAAPPPPELPPPKSPAAGGDVTGGAATSSSGDAGRSEDAAK